MLLLDSLAQDAVRFCFAHKKNVLPGKAKAALKQTSKKLVMASAVTTMVNQKSIGIIKAAFPNCMGAALVGISEKMKPENATNTRVKFAVRQRQCSAGAWPFITSSRITSFPLHKKPISLII